MINHENLIPGYGREKYANLPDLSAFTNRHSLNRRVAKNAKGYALVQGPNEAEAKLKTVRELKLFYVKESERYKVLGKTDLQNAKNVIEANKILFFPGKAPGLDTMTPYKKKIMGIDEELKTLENKLVILGETSELIDIESELSSSEDEEAAEKPKRKKPMKKRSSSSEKPKPIPRKRSSSISSSSSSSEEEREEAITNTEEIVESIEEQVTELDDQVNELARTQVVSDMIRVRISNMDVSVREFVGIRVQLEKSDAELKDLLDQTNNFTTSYISLRTMNRRLPEEFNNSLCYLFTTEKQHDIAHGSQELLRGILNDMVSAALDLKGNLADNEIVTLFIHSYTTIGVSLKISEEYIRKVKLFIRNTDSIKESYIRAVENAERIASAYYKKVRARTNARERVKSLQKYGQGEIKYNYGKAKKRLYLSSKSRSVRDFGIETPQEADNYIIDKIYDLVIRNRQLGFLVRYANWIPDTNEEFGSVVNVYNDNPALVRRFLNYYKPDSEADKKRKERAIKMIENAGGYIKRNSY